MDQVGIQVADYNRIVERVVVAVEVAVAQDLWMVVLLAVLLVAVAGTSKPNIVDTASKLLVVLPSQQESVVVGFLQVVDLEERAALGVVVA